MGFSNTARTALFSRHQTGGVWTFDDVKEHPGDIFFVDSGAANAADNTGNGRTPDKPFATLDYAIGQCTANQGDVIYVAPGHSETLTAAVTVDVAGIAIVGLGRGSLRPQFTVNANIDGLTVTAANCHIEGLYFNEGTNAHTASINVAAAHCTIRRCHFDCGANDLESITVTADGDDLLVEDCSWVVTANGPDAAIEIKGTSARLTVQRCHFDGGGDTNAWDAGAVNSGQAHTACRVLNNTFLYGAGVTFTAAATGLIALNLFGEGTLGSMLDPGSCMCFENYEADAVDQTGRLFPTTAAS